MDFNQITEQIMNPPDVTDMFAQDDIEGNKIIAAVSTFSLLFWLPLVACPNSAFGKHYANQSLLLFIFDVALGIVAGIVAAILGIIPILGGILGALISGVASLVSLAAWLLLFVSALQGKARKLPLIGDLFVAFK